MERERHKERDREREREGRKRGGKRGFGLSFFASIPPSLPIPFKTGPLVDSISSENARLYGVQRDERDPH